MNSGRFTVTGSHELETRMQRTVDAIADTARRTLDASEVRALVLIGGYGRGEGGVERTSAGELPHNNLDLLLVTRHVPVVGGSRACRAGDVLDAALEPIRSQTGIGIDVGAIADASLDAAPSLVMWSDMRQGHKTILGDASFVTGLERFCPASIVPDDVLALLANRVALLVFNRVLLERSSLNETVRRAVIKHGMKAVVGIGDAALHARGLYDGSYVEKRRRMRGATDIPAALRAAYDEAIAFRLDPDYTRVPTTRDALVTVNERLLGLAADVHLSFERRRLGDPRLDWDNYLDRAVGFAASRAPRGLRGLVRRVRDAANGPAATVALGPLGGLAAKSIGWRALLPLLLPHVAYRVLPGKAAGVLGAGGMTAPVLDRAYLRTWGEHMDPAFSRACSDLGVELESSKEAA